MNKRTKLSILFAALLPFSASAFEIYSDDDVTIDLGGRLQLDTLFPFDEDGNSYDFNVRRARIFIGGEFYEDWEAKLQLDFANSINRSDDKTTNRVDIKDAWLKYKGFDAADITLGQFKAPMSLQELTSSKYITILERAPVVDEIAISRRVGATASNSTDRITYAVGIFGDNLQEKSDRDTYGPVGRLVFHPFGKEDGTLHVGGSVGAIWGNEGYKDISYGLEAATVMGPIHGQFEYLGSDRSDDGEDENVSGWYAQGGWFLTGESRPYKAGAFKGVKPKNAKLGAWEIATRYGQLEGDGQWDIGANWYANKYVRLGVNYVNQDNDNLVQTRVQFAF